MAIESNQMVGISLGNVQMYVARAMPEGTKDDIHDVFCPTSIPTRAGSTYHRDSGNWSGLAQLEFTMGFGTPRPKDP